MYVIYLSLTATTFNIPVYKISRVLHTERSDPINFSSFHFDRRTSQPIFGIGAPLSRKLLRWSTIQTYCNCVVILRLLFIFVHVFCCCCLDCVDSCTTFRFYLLHSRSTMNLAATPNSVDVTLWNIAFDGCFPKISHSHGTRWDVVSLWAARCTHTEQPSLKRDSGCIATAYI